MSRLSVLLVAYAFPPVGGAGVQRMTKLAKYLPRHGVITRVLTASNPSAPLRDESLLADLPPEVTVLRAKTFEPGYEMKQAAWSAMAEQKKPTLKQQLMRRATGFAKQLLIPDAQLLWQPGAARVLAQRVARRSDDAVLVSAPPFSQFVSAPLVRLRSGVGLVLDYRDEWSTYRTAYEMGASRFASLVGEQLETVLLRAAHFVTTATEEFRENILSRFSFLDPARVIAIPNGYDRDDLPEVLPQPEKSGNFTIVYAGTLFKLTSARGFLQAVRRLHTLEPELARNLRVRFIGRIVDTELDAFEGTEALGVERLGYVPHDQVLPALARSHLSLCILDEVPGVERIYPAKIFEQMMLGRATLTLAPDGALAKLVDQHGLGPRLLPRDVEGIAEFLIATLRDFAAGKFVTDMDAKGIERYDRYSLAGEFADVLCEAKRVASR